MAKRKPKSRFSEYGTVVDEDVLGMRITYRRYGVDELRDKDFLWMWDNMITKLEWLDDDEEQPKGEVPFDIMGAILATVRRGVPEGNSKRQ